MKLRSKKGQTVTVHIDFMHFQENTHLDGIMEKEQHLVTMEYCMEQLPGNKSWLLNYFIWKKNVIKEIAETTNTDINKVRSFIQNGRRNLKICMEKQTLEKA